MAPVAVYFYNACEIRDFDEYITIKTPYNEIYKYSTFKRKYCYLLTGTLNVNDLAFCGVVFIVPTIDIIWFVVSLLSSLVNIICFNQ